MALVKFGQGVAKYMGTIGGTIFSQNKGGNYAKNYNVPTNPQSDAQLLVRAHFSAISVAWNLLTQANRDTWIAYAPLVPYTNSVGDIYFLTGKGMFQKCNTALLNIAQPQIDEVAGEMPVPPPPADFSISATVALQDIIITSTDINVPAEVSFVLDGAPQSNASVINNNALYRRLSYSPNGTPWNAANIGGIYIARFGALALGQRIDIRLAAVSELNGFISSYQKASTIVVA